MNKPRLTLIAAVVVTVAAIVIAVHYRNKAVGLESELAGALARAAEANRLQTENERLVSLEKELGRVREEAKELPRLRGGVARLRRELGTATNQAARLAASGTIAAAPAEPSQTNSTTFTGVARASLAPGQTLVTGGWPLEAGKRTIALFTPAAAPEGHQGTVVIGGVFMQVPETLLSGPGWEQFQAVTREASGSGVLDAEQTKKFLDSLQKMEGVEILSSPRLATTSGGAGTISIGEENGSGLTTTLLPVVAADGQTVDLSVSNWLRFTQK